MVAAVVVVVTPEDTGSGGWMKETLAAVIVDVVSIDSGIGAFVFGKAGVLPCCMFGTELTESPSTCSDCVANKDGFGIGGGGCNIISLDVISLSMVCQMTSVMLANNTRYSEGKLYVMTFAGVQTLAFAINNGTNLACIWAGICRIGEPLNNAGIGISHTV